MKLVLFILSAFLVKLASMLYSPCPSLIQFLLAPVFIVAISCLRIGKYRVSRFVPVVAACVVAVAAVYAFSLRANEGNLVVATLSKDTLEVQSYRLRTSIRYAASLHKGQAVASLNPVRYFKEFSDPAEVGRFLNAHPKLSVLLWGNKKWLNLSFQEAIPQQLSLAKYLPRTSWLANAKYIASAPGVSMSFAPRGATADFVSLVAAASEMVVKPDQTLDLAEREIMLLQAASITSPWKSDEHRALPWFLLGNLRLEGVLNARTYQGGEIDCVIAAYKSARAYLRVKNKGSADLFAAVFNNLAIAEGLKAVMEGDPKASRKMRQILRQALVVRKAENIYKLEHRPAAIARANLALAKAAAHKEKSRKRM